MASKKKNGGAGDLSTQILLQIRDEMRAMHGEQRSTNERLDTTNERLDRLERRQGEDATRLATELVAVAGAVAQVRDLLREQHADRAQMEDFQRRLVALEKRTA